MNTTENNRLILDFMGVKPAKFSDNYQWRDGIFFVVVEEEEEKAMEAICKYAKYSTDWNWLMKLVEKCLIGEVEKPQEIISHIYDALCNISLSETYNACLRFIKWYNQQKS